MEISVNIPNLPQIKQALAAYPTISAKHVNDAIKRSVFEIQAESVTRTPVANPMSWKRPNPKYKPGRLKGSYTVTFAPLQGILEPMVNYAIYVHEGTRFMQSRPFLKQGIEAAQDKVQRHFENAVSDTLNEIAEMSK